LLLTGVVLHDLGKIYELTYERSFGYSNEGQLLGHILIVLRMIDEKLRHLPDFPPRLRSLVEHMVVSHHGELEFGSPKTPMFLEAMLLHHIDNLDSKLETMRQAVKRDRAVAGAWTGYIASLERPVLKKERYLESPSAAPPSPEPSPVTPEPRRESAAGQPSLFGDKLKQALR
jgi:3'-5' exoribonuclease